MESESKSTRRIVVHIHTLHRWQHGHVFDVDRQANERKTTRVVILTASMMVLEIIEPNPALDRDDIAGRFSCTLGIAFEPFSSPGIPSMGKPDSIQFGSSHYRRRVLCTKSGIDSLAATGHTTALRDPRSSAGHRKGFSICRQRDLMDGFTSKAPLWYSWTWCLILSAVSYLAFYFVVGGLNYQLVTKPYYETHAGGLTVPPVHVVLVVESIRAVLIVFSVFLFVLSARGARRQLMSSTGWLLFAVGGIIPLLWEISSLPIFLLAASAVEIFFQNFFTGVVAARLLGLESKDEIQVPVAIKAGVT